RCKSAFRPDDDKAVELALVVQMVEAGTAEDGIGCVSQRGIAAHRDVQQVAHRACSAIRADKIIRLDLLFATAGNQLCGYAVRMLDKTGEFGAIAHRNLRKGPHEARENGIEQVLRTPLAFFRALRLAGLSVECRKRFAPEFKSRDR